MPVLGEDTFDDWIVREYGRTDGFTALVFLMEIANLSVAPLRSTFMHVIGNEIDWLRFTVLLEGAGVRWDGVLLYPVAADGGGPVADDRARQKLQEMAVRITENRMVINEGHFFDQWGRRMKVEEAQPQ